MKMHIAVFSYALCVAAWQVASSAETSKQVPKQRSLPMCASGLRPWMESGTKAQSCGRPTEQPCPSGYVCEPQANVCCPAPADDKSTTAGGTQPTAPTRPDGKGQKQSCSADNDCLPPSICKDSGYCCLLRLDQEPPPVGCPFGTRPLKNAQGQEVSCSPSQAGSCPGDTMCYQDSLTGSYHCCGKDPGEGCPSGSRAVKAGGKVVTCTPGSATQSCQGKALCQWSYIIDRYQCCEADNVEEKTIKIKTTTIQIKTTTPENSEAGVTETENRKRVTKNGCPTGFAPLLSAPTGSAQACRPDGSQSCPANYGCEFNFWSAAYQCCGRDLGQCATSGQVPYLEPQSGSARQCNVGAVNQCPAGYTCSQTTTGQFMCCGTAGRCPAQFTTVLDLQGRPQACRQGAPSGSISGCKSPATCQSAVGGVVGQYLCCSSNTGGGSVQCAIGGHSPYPSAATPQYCNMNVPNCAAGSVCEPSNIAGTYVCCKPSGGTGQNACPNGWTLTNGVQTFCNPASASCAARGTCLASTLVPNQFVCCTPGGTGVTQYSCPQGTPVSGTAGGNQFCSGIGGSCPVATGSLATCQQAVNAPGTYICCYAQQSQNYICPNSGSPYMMGGNQYQYCTPTAPNCNAPYTCQQSVNVPSVSICCTGGSSTTNLHCQGNGTPALTGNNQNVVCNVNVPNMCPQGSTCQSSLESTAVSICCYGNQPTNVRCPDGSQPSTLGTQPQTCTPFGANSCSNGYTCQQAMGVAGTYVCCRSATTPTDYTCPAGFQPYRAPGSSALTFCNRQNPTNCVGGTTCLQATNAPQYSICCSSSTGSSLCPAGQQALLGANQQPVFCNSPADYCSSPGYTCQVSPTLGRYICCGSGTSVRPQCRNGQPSYTTPGTSAPQQCNPSSPSTGCPAGYTCSASTISTQYICCQSGSTLTPTACANSALAPYKPYGQVIQCRLGYQNACQGGSTCQASNVANIAICCSQPTFVNAKCPIGWSGYQAGTSIQRCSSLSDTSCPTGYSCSQSTIQGTLLCCRYGSTPGTSLQCYNGAQVYTFPSSSQPMTCQQGMNTCPSGYTCQPSTRPSISVCCSSGGTGTQFTCRSTGQPAYTFSGQPRFCTQAGVASTCPNGFVCDYSNVNNVLVCCASGGTSTGFCPAGSQPYMQGTSAQTCSPTYNTCPTGYTCERNARGQYYCCQAARCADGTPNPTKCTPGTSGQCGYGQNCVQSVNMPSTYVCCGTSTAGGARCVGRDTKLQAGSTAPVTCQPGGYTGQCGNGYECSQFTTTGQYVCCASVGTTAPVCPNAREPYRNPDTNSYHYCDSTSYDCPDGFVCKKMLNTNIVDRYVCCSDLPSCQPGWLPYIDPAVRQAKRCSPTSASTSTCSPTPGWPYKCQQSTVPGTYLCCMESAKSPVKLDGPNEGGQTEGDKDEKPDGWWSWPENDASPDDKPAETVDLSQQNLDKNKGGDTEDVQVDGDWVVWGSEKNDQ